MTSSTLAGERRWASARRGGMTVLGKVAVPKPLNLPSQRLENHGLDPTVEIVPKGTLNWGSGSRPSTNPWGSSLSPTPDSSSNSTNLLSGRPSSGGSGTRPSTGGSDRPVVEPSNNAWGPNSRPSSASGVLASNQSSLTSLRPHSAEARPVSSQLSRFAEPVSESSGAWGGSGTAERLGVVSSKKEDFSLSSGDFPTLGTESKDQGSHSRPTSASDRVPHTKDKTVTTHPDETVNQGTRGIPQNVGGDQCMEKWQGEHHQYFNPNMPPQHFDGWRGPPPPMNGPPVWYGGPPHGPPPYGGGPGPGPGGYPVEPFPYYHHRPQLPPPPFPNSQTGPPPRGGGPGPGPGPGPRGHHPNTGNAFRPQMPDPYARPGMPFRPNFYPPMGFDGYYRPPPMGYCNSNERDNPPYMGMGGGGGPPPVYDRFPPQNAPDPNEGYARTGGPGPGPGPRTDNEPAHPGPYKVILKHHNNEWGDEKEQGEKRVHVPPVKDEKARKYEWGAEDNEEEEDIYSNLSFEKRGVSDTVQAKNSQGVESMKQVESVTSSSSSSSHMVTGRGGPALLSTPKDPTLMRKIEGLNAKVRASDERVDYGSNAKDISTNKGASHSGYSAPNPHQMGVLGGDKAAQPIPQMSRRPYNEMQSRTDHHGKGRFGNQEPDGWRKRPVSGSKMEPIFNAQERDQHQSVKSAVMNPNPNPLGKNEDFHDSAEQRAKLKEMVKERGLRLQKEEEERIREQKAKALAKLEELNRRMQSGKTPESGTHQKEEIEPIESVTKVEPPVKTEAVSSQTVGPVETSKSTEIEPVVLKEEVVNVNVNVNEGKSGLQVNEGGPTRHNNKRTSYKQKQATTTTIKSSNEKSVSDNIIEAQKPVNDSVSNVVASSEINSNLPNSSSIVSETSGPQKRKNNKGGKNKNKQDNAPAPPPVTVSPVNVPPSESIPPPTSQPSNITVDPTEHREDPHGRVNMNTNMTNQWKPHQPRRMPRNQQVNKFHSNEAVVWAPVQSHNKPENKPEAITVTEDPKPMVISVTPVNKSDNNPVHNNAKSKRAEIERYVPKPVAQHIELQHPGPPDETVVQQFKEEVVITNSSKHGKVQGAWRPRGPTDVIPNKGSSSQSFDPEAKSDPKLDPKSDTSRSSDVAAPDISVVTGRGKSHTNRGGHKSVRGGAHVQSHATPDISQSDSSHWQPKTQKGSQNVGVKKEYNPRVKTPPQHKIESNESGTHEVRRERKFNNNNNNNTSKGHVDESSGPHPPPVRTHHSQRYGNQTRDWSGHDNNNNNNNNNMGWSGQGHDNRERQYNMDRDNRPRSGGPYNRDRPRSGQDNRPMENRHYEYQPVGSSSSSSYNNNMKNNNGDGSQYGGGSSRYREKGRGGYSKRGGGGNGGGGGGNGGGYREQQQITPVHVEADAGWE